MYTYTYIYIHTLMYSVNEGLIEDSLKRGLHSLKRGLHSLKRGLHSPGVWSCDGM